MVVTTMKYRHLPCVLLLVIMILSSQNTIYVKEFTAYCSLLYYQAMNQQHEHQHQQNYITIQIPPTGRAFGGRRGQGGSLYV